MKVGKEGENKCKNIFFTYFLFNEKFISNSVDLEQENRGQNIFYLFYPTFEKYLLNSMW